jgi:RNA polymerase sigma-70 factor (ECF subfamily)
MTHSTSVNDEAIVAQVIAGDIAAYAALIERYESKLNRYVAYLIHDQVGAQDAVQETFLKAYQNLRSFNPHYKFSSWIYRIAHNEAMNIVKQHKYTSYEDVDTLPDEPYESTMDDLIDTAIMKGHVHECLDQLELKYREAVRLVYFEGMKYDDVSDVMHVPASTVGVWLSRAKSKLKTICEQKGEKR